MREIRTLPQMRVLQAVPVCGRLSAALLEGNGVQEGFKD